MRFDTNYDCIYEADGTAIRNGQKNIVHVALGHYACYAHAYRQIRFSDFADVTYRVYLFKDNMENCNYNLCDKLETKKILRCLQKIVPFNYCWKKGIYFKGPYNKEKVKFNILEVHISGKYQQHVWITSMLRCFYEWPYNIAAKEACELQCKLKVIDGFDFSNENWVNLYLCVVSLLGSTECHGVVDFNNQPLCKTYQEWQQKIANLKEISVFNQITQTKYHYNSKIKPFRIRSQEEFDKGIQDRVSKYVAAYKDKLSWKK